MIVEFGFPTDVWEIIPRSFPTVDGTSEEAWRERLIAAYVASVGEQDGQTREIVSALAAKIRKQISPLDVATVLFRPVSLPITAVVHIQLFDGDGFDTREAIATAMVPDIPFALPPAVQPFSSESLGEGKKAAFIGAETFPDGTSAGGLSYAFSSAGQVVTIQSSPARLDVVGILEQHLDALVLTVKLAEGVVSGVEQVS